MMAQPVQQQQPTKKPKPPIYCRGCDNEIKFHPKHRREDVRWIRLNLDMTEHICPGRQQQPQQQTEEKEPNNQLTFNNKVMVTEAQIATLAEQVQALTTKVEILSIDINQLKSIVTAAAATVAKNGSNGGGQKNKK